MDDLEIWKDIPSWSNLYQASSLGRIRSLPNKQEVLGRHGMYTRTYGGKILSPKTGRGSYLYVNLWNANKGHMRAVHRLVCEAFNFQDNHSHLVTNHKDCNRQNNKAENLEFITQKENLVHAAQFWGDKPIWKLACEQKASRRNSLSAS